MQFTKIVCNSLIEWTSPVSSCGRLLQR